MTETYKYKLRDLDGRPVADSSLSRLDVICFNQRGIMNAMLQPV